MSAVFSDQNNLAETTLIRSTSLDVTGKILDRDAFHIANAGKRRLAKSHDEITHKLDRERSVSIKKYFEDAYHLKRSLDSIKQSTGDLKQLDRQVKAKSTGNINPGDSKDGKTKNKNLLSWESRAIKSGGLACDCTKHLLDFLEHQHHKDVINTVKAKTCRNCGNLKAFHRDSCFSSESIYEPQFRRGLHAELSLKDIQRRFDRIERCCSSKSLNDMQSTGKHVSNRSREYALGNKGNQESSFTTGNYRRRAQTYDNVALINLRKQTKIHSDVNMENRISEQPQRVKPRFNSSENLNQHYRDNELTTINGTTSRTSSQDSLKQSSPSSSLLSVPLNVHESDSNVKSAKGRIASWSRDDFYFDSKYRESSEPVRPRAHTYDVKSLTQLKKKLGNCSLSNTEISIDNRRYDKLQNNALKQEGTENSSRSNSYESSLTGSPRASLRSESADSLPDAPGKDTRQDTRRTNSGSVRARANTLDLRMFKGMRERKLQKISSSAIRQNRTELPSENGLTIHVDTCALNLKSPKSKHVGQNWSTKVKGGNQDELRLVSSFRRRSRTFEPAELESARKRATEKLRMVDTENDKACRVIEVVPIEDIERKQDDSNRSINESAANGTNTPEKVTEEDDSFDADFPANNTESLQTSRLLRRRSTIETITIGDDLERNQISVFDIPPRSAPVGAWLPDIIDGEKQLEDNDENEAVRSLRLSNDSEESICSKYTHDCNSPCLGDQFASQGNTESSLIGPEDHFCSSSEENFARQNLNCYQEHNDDELQSSGKVGLDSGNHLRSMFDTTKPTEQSSHRGTFSISAFLPSPRGFLSKKKSSNGQPQSTGFVESADNKVADSNENAYGTLSQQLKTTFNTSNTHSHSKQNGDSHKLTVPHEKPFKSNTDPLLVHNKVSPRITRKKYKVAEAPMTSQETKQETLAHAPHPPITPRFFTVSTNDS